MSCFDALELLHILTLVPQLRQHEGILNTFVIHQGRLMLLYVVTASPV